MGLEVSGACLGHSRLETTQVYFFQAEDGIRALTVTGVQTCALPIFEHRARRRDVAFAGQRTHDSREAAREVDDAAQVVRSEERRVGKECRCRWAPCN